MKSFVSICIVCINCCLFFVSSESLAGAPLSIGGNFQNAGDGTTFENATWSMGHVSGVELSQQTMSTSDTYWYGEAGHFFTNLQVGDELVVGVSKEVGEGVDAKGYYGVMSAQLTGEDPQPFDTLVLREVPVPTLENTPEGILVSFTIESESAPIVGTNVLGADVFGSADGETFTQLNSGLITDSQFLHTTPFGIRFYAVSLQLRALSFTPLSAATTRAIVPGDLDDSGSVDLKDVILGLQALSGSQNPISVDASISGNGKVEMSDVIHILNNL